MSKPLALISSTFKSPILYLGTMLFVIMAISYYNYGISWDEATQRNTAWVNYNYIMEGNPELLNYFDRDYGVVFELPMVFIEKAFNLKNWREIFLSRRIFSHSFFLIAAIYFYALLRKLGFSQWLSIIGVLMLILNPRIYAHSFFNTKDVPFLGMLIIGFYYTVQFLKFRSIHLLILLSIICGILINIRIIGVLLPMLVCFLFFIHDLKSKAYKKLTIQIILFITLTVSVLIITWPFLWSAPLDNFIEAFNNMARFRWDGTLLYLGVVMHGTEIPFHYILGWFVLSNPLIYIVLGAIGLCLFGRSLLLNFRSFFEKERLRFYFIFLCFFIAPIIAVIVLDSVVYDGWRQLFFIYPSFILFAVYALHIILEKTTKKYNRAIFGILILNFFFLSTFMVLNQPIMQCYFNPILALKMGNNLERYMELDYWGPSYKSAIDQILTMHPNQNDTLRINFDHTPGIENVKMLEDSLQNRIIISNIEDADYFVTNYRNRYTRFSNTDYLKVWSHKIYDSEVVSIFKLNYVK